MYCGQRECRNTLFLHEEKQGLCRECVKAVEDDDRERPQQTAIAGEHNTPQGHASDTGGVRVSTHALSGNICGKKRIWTLSNPLDAGEGNRSSVAAKKLAINGIDCCIGITTPPSALATCPSYIRVFDHLYQVLAQDAHRGFDTLTKRHSQAEVLQIIDGALHRATKEIIAEEAYTDKNKLLGIGGDIKYPGAGWYSDVLTDEHDSDWFRTYIGQGERIKVRIDYHKKSSLLKKGSALHYQLLRKTGRRYNYVVLGTLPEITGVDTQVLDVVEMYLGLLFQALPPKTLRKYLPEGTELRQPERGCMIANPLNQHHDDEAARRSACQLRDSTDPEVRDHYKNACDYLRNVEYVPSMEAMRVKSSKKDLLRAPIN